MQDLFKNKIPLDGKIKLSVAGVSENGRKKWFWIAENQFQLAGIRSFFKNWNSSMCSKVVYNIFRVFETLTILLKTYYLLTQDIFNFPSVSWFKPRCTLSFLAMLSILCTFGEVITLQLRVVRQPCFLKDRRGIFQGSYIYEIHKKWTILGPYRPSAKMNNRSIV